MFGDDGFHVWCATVADLECVCIEYLVVFVSSCEVFLDDRDEFLTDVCFDCFVVRWVEPDDLSAAACASALGGCADVRYFVSVSAVF